MTPIPTLVKRGDKEVIIEWNDGHRSVYTGLKLRRACPCASCQNLHGEPKQPQDPFRIIDANEASPESLTLRRIEAVGNYALQFQWSDGHNTGIYTYQYLRELG